MKNIKLYEYFSCNDELLNKRGYPTPQEITDYFINKIDSGDIEVDEFQTQEVLDREFDRSWKAKNLIYFKNEKIDKGTITFDNESDYDSYKQQNINLDQHIPHGKDFRTARHLGEPRRYPEEILALAYLKVSIPHPFGIRGNLNRIDYTIDTLQYYLKKFVMRSGYKVNIIVSIEETHISENPLSKSIIRIEFLK